MLTREIREGLQNATIPLQYVFISGDFPAASAAGTWIDVSPTRPIYYSPLKNWN